MAEIVAIELQPVWKVKVQVWVNGDLSNTYFKPDNPQVQIEAWERLYNIGSSFNTGPQPLDLKDRNPMTYAGVMSGDNVRKVLTVEQV